jgi:hypothetical protein
LFRDHDNAGKAYNAALKLGYKKEEINVLMSEETKKQHGYDRKHPPDHSLTDEAIKGAGIGGSLGVTTGAITGAIMAAGTLIAISGIGLAISGPLAVGLAGAGAGGIAGGLVGALMNAGIAEDHAKNFEAEIKNGSIMIGLAPHSLVDCNILESKWSNYGGIVLTPR